LPLSRIGKGTTRQGCLALAFFLLFLILPLCHAQNAAQSAAQSAAQLHAQLPADFPVITRLDPGDTGFKQFMSDVEGNRRFLVNPRAQAEKAAERLTIYQYTVKPSDDIFFLAARLNMPYSALASLNRINSPSALEPGSLILLPSCPGIFIPESIETDIEKILGAAREKNENSVELKINAKGKMNVFLFFPGADFTPTERAFFLNAGFRFPLKSYRITSRYGIRNDPLGGHQQMHRGIDLAAPEGTEVFAVADGTVAAAGFDSVFGNYVIINHTNNYSSLYGHLQKIDVVLRSDVKSGTLIGKVGSTGQSTGPHLHFELRLGGRSLDPSGRLRP